MHALPRACLIFLRARMPTCMRCCCCRGVVWPVGVAGADRAAHAAGARQGAFRGSQGEAAHRGAGPGGAGGAGRQPARALHHGPCSFLFISSSWVIFFSLFFLLRVIGSCWELLGVNLFLLVPCSSWEWCLAGRAGEAGQHAAVLLAEQDSR
ncbi:hypothetical protein COO60DRAFT_1103019 [Scenedesmus sp. NREL 46B-D3]|nr:hypothetical protein COO60DRAFT_1103019 [Scenedesmus sp. NREL 46B-D3]